MVVVVVWLVVLVRVLLVLVLPMLVLLAGAPAPELSVGQPFGERGRHVLEVLLMRPLERQVDDRSDDLGEEYDGDGQVEYEHDLPEGQNIVRPKR